MKNSSKDYRRNQHSKLMWMALVSFVFMYVLLFAMVDGFDGVDATGHPLVLAMIMTFPTIIIEVLLLGGIQKDLKTSLMMVSLGLLAFLTFYHILIVRPQIRSA